MRLTRPREIRIGLVGCGPYSRLVAAGHAANPRARLAAVCDVRPEPARALADEFGADAVFADYAEMLDRGKVDAVEILYGPDSHRAIAERAFAKGKHVSIHKPIAQTIQDAKAIAEAGHAARVARMVVDPLLFHPPVRDARGVLDDERLGELQTIRIKSSVSGCGGWGPGFDPAVLDDPEAPVLLLTAFDKAALLEALFGAITRVFAFGGGGRWMISYRFNRPRRYGMHEAVYSPDLAVRSQTYSVDEQVEIAGTDGVLWLRNLTGRTLEAPPLMMKRKARVTVWDDRADYGPASCIAAAGREFVDSIRRGDRTGRSVRDGVRALAVNLAAHRSAREARPVEIDELVR